MKLSHQAVESLLRLGRFREIVADCGDDVDGIRQLPSSDHRLAIAEALARVGQLDSAVRLASATIARSTSDSSCARGEMILGAVARDLGNFDEAVARLQRSTKLAQESDNYQQAALSSLLAFRIISERQPRAIVASLLGDLRSMTTRAADPHITGLLHESVAREEAQVGNFDEASRHLRITDSLLATHPNALLEQLSSVNAFCISYFSCDLKKAERHLRHASSIAEVTGALESTISNNHGHLQLLLGNFKKAEEILTRVAASSRGEVLLSALEGLARLRLALGQFDECEETLNRLEELDRVSFAFSFPFRAGQLSRIRVLIRRGRSSEAVRLSETTVAQALDRGDRNFAATAMFLHAEALANTGRRAQAANAICAAGMLGAWTIREHQGSFMRTCGEILRSEDPQLALKFARRADRLWHIQGNSYARTEAEPWTTNEGNGVDSPSWNSKGSLVNSLANAFDLAYDARLLGAELVEAIENAGCSGDVRLIAGKTSRELDPISKQCHVSLGENHNGLTLRCRIPSEPAKAVLLADILRIAQAAVALERSQEEKRNRAALWPAEPVEQQAGALFISEEMRTLLATAQRIAPTNVPVLITGETGTGKEVLARTIHAYSNRAKAVFLPFNCTSTPRDMLDSQLFGHRRGAFTGAVESFQGVIRGAAGGTLFLDEIGDTTLEVQPKLLRFLESNEIHAIGDAHPTRVDVRVIVATNADLDALVAQGRFREDLYYRLNIVPLHLPPLRDRRVEIPALAHHYLQKHAQEMSKGDLRLAEETMEYLVLYRWPGNVRQLANEMRRLATLSEPGAVLMPEHLSAHIAASRRTIPPSERRLDPTELVVRMDQPMTAAVQHVERAMIQHALRQCGGRVEDTAALLGISRKGLYLKRQRLGIEPPDRAVAADVA